MAAKRLFYFYALFGGAVGVIPLGAGSADLDALLVDGFIMQLDPVTSGGPATFDFGTVAEPTLLTDSWGVGDLTTGVPRNIRNARFDLPQPTVASPWAIQINGAPLTGGVIEVWFELVRRT